MYNFLYKEIDKTSLREMDPSGGFNACWMLLLQNLSKNLRQSFSAVLVK